MVSPVSFSYIPISLHYHIINLADNLSYAHSSQHDRKMAYAELFCCMSRKLVLALVFGDTVTWCISSIGETGWVKRVGGGVVRLFTGREPQVEYGRNDNMGTKTGEKWLGFQSSCCFCTLGHYCDAVFFLVSSKTTHKGVS